MPRRSPPDGPKWKTGPKPRPLEERYWAKVNKTEGALQGCWEWTGAIRNGYGVIGLGGRGAGVVGAHRLSWEWHHGPIPEDLWVLHRCDNRRCVRPDHLFLGTNADNHADMWSKGRGYVHPTAKLQPDDVRAIRAALAAGVSQNELARRYGVWPGQIWNIAHGITWKHVR